MIVYTKKQEQIVLEDVAFSSGGEGEVHLVKLAPNNYPSKSCVKIYYQNKRSRQQQQKIEYMVDNPPQQVSGKGYMIGWPLASICDENGSFMGFLMPLAFAGSKQLVNLTPLKLSKKLGGEWFQRYDRDNGKYALISRLKLINNIAIPVHLLHATNKYVLQDFKPQNVLVTPDGQITVVDMDSVQISDKGRLLFPGTAKTDLYIPIEFYTENIGRDNMEPLNQSWDRFALGVVFYQLLFGLHPYVVTPWAMKDDSSNEIPANIAKGLFPFGPNADKIRSYPEPHKKFNILPEPVKDLFIKAFTGAPDDRPTASMWGKTIRDILRDVTMPPIPPMPDTPVPKPNNTGGTTSGGSSSGSTLTDPPQPKPSKDNSGIWTIVIVIIIFIVLGILGSVC